MADGVAITAGAGTTILTDDTGVGGHVQVVKLAISTDGSGTLIPAEATNGLDVDVTRVQGTVAVSNAGTFATQVDGAALTALQLLDDTIKADDAGFTVGTDKVSMAGMVAVAHGANPDAADANDAVAPLANRHRVQFVIGGHPNVVNVSASYTTTQADTAIITVGAGSKIVVTSISLMADGGGTGPLDVQIGFGATTVGTTDLILDHPGLVKGSGVVLGNGGGILGVGADGADLRIDATGFGTGDELTVCVTYYTIES